MYPALSVSDVGISGVHGVEQTNPAFALNAKALIGINRGGNTKSRLNNVDLRRLLLL